VNKGGWGGGGGVFWLVWGGGECYNCARMGFLSPSLEEISLKLKVFYLRRDVLSRSS